MPAGRIFPRGRTYRQIDQGVIADCDNTPRVGYGSRVDGALARAFFDVAAALVGCGHVSGLLMRRVRPLALMLCAERVPIENTHLTMR
jgi:hypothetical protein